MEKNQNKNTKKDYINLLLTISVGLFTTILLVLLIVQGGKGDNKPGDKESLKQENSSLMEASTDNNTEDTNEATDESTEDEIGFQDETSSTEESTDKNQTTEEPTTAEPVEIKYLIKINRVMNCITVYTKDDKGNYTVPYKAMICSTCDPSKCKGNKNNTPLGEFAISVGYKWCRMVDETYAQYAIRFKGSIMFHSVPYYTYDRTDLEYNEFNKLGSVASLGCVRLCTRDAKWIYENCPAGTKVIVYDDKSSPGPLGKPEMIKIPENHPNRGWDPTDTDKNNPWNNCKPTISSKGSVTVASGAYDSKTILKALSVVAKDTCTNDVTDTVKISGSIDFNKEGTYQVKLTVTDLLGRKAEKNVTIKIEKSAAKEPETEAPETETPETEAPTPEETTTEAPTTEAPTTEETITEAAETEETTTVAEQAVVEQSEIGE